MSNRILVLPICLRRQSVLKLLWVLGWRSGRIRRLCLQSTVYHQESNKSKKVKALRYSFLSTPDLRPVLGRLCVWFL